MEDFSTFLYIENVPNIERVEEACGAICPMTKSCEVLLSMLEIWLDLFVSLCG